MFKDILSFIAWPFKKIYQAVKDFFFPEPKKPPPAKPKGVMKKPIQRSSSYKTISILLPPSTTEHARSYSDPAKKRLSFNSITYVCDTKGMVKQEVLFGHNIRNAKYRPYRPTLVAKMLSYFNKEQKQKKPKPSRHSY